MTAFYLRWGMLLIVAMVLVILTYRNYEQNLVSLTPEAVLENPPSGDVRVLGLVKGGSLKGDPEKGQAQFDLAGAQKILTVHYDGPPPENLRELKTLIVVGQWKPTERIFQARDLALVTNYGFVLSAYLIGLIPLAVFLFTMGRRVSLLYEEIKQSKLYHSEWDEHVDAR